MVQQLFSLQLSLRSTCRVFAALLTMLAVVILSPPAEGQTEFNARPFITVDVNNNPAQRTDVPTESVYVPGVVASENGLASYEALKAQAVAARTFAYYILDLRTPSVIGDGQNDQVFSNIAPRTIHRDASRATEGEILYIEDFQLRDILIASFYVAGAIPSGPFNPADPSAIPNSFDPDPTNTERFVTYTYENDLSGGFNTGSTLGFRGTPTNPNWPNRGAMSQNGGDFLSDNSVSYVDILKYYYGADIQLRTATTAGTGVEFGRKVLTDFDDYGSGRASDGIIDGNEGYFGRSPTFSGSTTPNIAGSTAVRDDTMPHQGSHSQRIDITYDETSEDDFLLRHISGAQFSDFGGQSNVASRVANLQFEAIGSVGFWLRTEDEGLQVSLAIDDPTTGDRGRKRDVIADGQWHQYKWFLEDAAEFEAWIGAGNGAVDGELITIDSIQFFGATDATVYLDTVFWDPSDELTSTAFGDFNGDNIVDAIDYSLWRDSLGSTSNLAADANDDGTVNIDDYFVWKSNYGRQQNPAFIVAAPEPTSLISATLGVVALIACRQSRSR
ncbi:MAG: SpoIID/LytB domain-containing protein [Planctomycetota bacterium]